VFSIASITKTFVTATIMQLVDEGTLSLDTRLSRFLPDYPRAKRITIRQLLAHTSGVFNYFESAAYQRAAYRDPSRRWTTKQILGFTGAPYCAPGDCFHYSNTNFVLLGEVIRSVTGRSVAREIRERFLEPLGLQHTGYQPDDRTPANAAHGHLWGGKDVFYDWTGKSRRLPTMSVATLAGSAGAMYSNAADLATWMIALYGSDTIVRPDLLDQMLTFRKRDQYGLGTRTRVFDGRRAVGHGGSLRGYENQVWYFPEEGVSIVLLSNRGLYLPDRTVRQLMRTLWKHIDVPEPQYDPTRNTK
jgi:D-alanyl-D-alanine carboxypeptidase